MYDWQTQGCKACRDGVLSGMYSPIAAARAGVQVSPPSFVCTCLEAHSHLHHCNQCGAWWEFNEREAHVITDTEAQSTFSAHFLAEGAVK